MASTTRRFSGTCSKCGKAAHYQAEGWVHSATGNCLSRQPVLHDVNTYVEIPARKAS